MRLGETTVRLPLPRFAQTFGWMARNRQICLALDLILQFTQLIISLHLLCLLHMLLIFWLFKWFVAFLIKIRCCNHFCLAVHAGDVNLGQNAVSRKQSRVDEATPLARGCKMAPFLLSSLLLGVIEKLMNVAHVLEILDYVETLQRGLALWFIDSVFLIHAFRSLAAKYRTLSIHRRGLVLLLLSRLDLKSLDSLGGALLTERYTILHLLILRRHRLLFPSRTYTNLQIAVRVLRYRQILDHNLFRNPLRLYADVNRLWIVHVPIGLVDFLGRLSDRLLFLCIFLWQLQGKWLLTMISAHLLLAQRSSVERPYVSALLPHRRQRFDINALRGHDGARHRKLINILL